MRILSWFLITIVLTLNASCQGNSSKYSDEGEVADNIYRSREIGWTMEILPGWKLIEVSESEDSQEKGLEVMQENIQEEIDAKGLKNLISFKKDEFNMFAATAEPLEPEQIRDYNHNNEALKEMIISTFENQGIDAVASQTKIEIIDNLEFQSYTITISHNGAVVLEQILLSRVINNHDFGVNINYNNMKDRDAMLNALRKSKFTKQ